MLQNEGFLHFLKKYTLRFFIFLCFFALFPLISGQNNEGKNKKNSRIWKFANSIWTKFYCSNCLNDANNNDGRNERGVAVIETSDNGYLLTGHIESFGESGGFFVWVVKKLVWGLIFLGGEDFGSNSFN